ncbi:hypothetical protein KFL_000400360 [Klebsormidium nitens]|uniref:DUF7886 domain-containing protein n=1 Tax=Klebsormidium nitens TaxID=105231 RepID=A0A1Y1HQ32_KLENI|nr:hypothetical protein KFL_000400360 [Klebsormidium nitens]|eukprot:GAQ79892.1 hypothetical protein KFL_000400360 [Klebsormidium nitens]
MEDLYKDLLRFGCLKGFKHFSVYLRGREELLITVRTPPNADCEPVAHCENAVVSPSKRLQRVSSLRTGKSFPPASPAIAEAVKPVAPEETVFLVGAYARYNWPYVWLRSQNPRIADATLDMDLPLDLQSTREWESRRLRVWDIVEELVLMNIGHDQSNPFEVDHEALAKMNRLQRSLLSAALAYFLRELLLDGAAYSQAVRRDLQLLLESHFNDMAKVFPGFGATDSKPIAAH